MVRIHVPEVPQFKHTSEGPNCYPVVERLPSVPQSRNYSPAKSELHVQIRRITAVEKNLRALWKAIEYDQQWHRRQHSS